MIIDEAVGQWRGVHVFELAVEHAVDILNTRFKDVWLLYFDSHMFVTLPNANSGYFMFSDDLAKLAIIIAVVVRRQI